MMKNVLHTGDDCVAQLFVGNDYTQRGYYNAPKARKNHEMSLLLHNSKIALK